MYNICLYRKKMFVLCQLLKRYCSKSMLLKNWDLFEVYNCSALNLIPLFPLFAKIDSISLTPYHRQSCVSKFCDNRKGWICRICCWISNITLLSDLMFDNQAWRSLFCNKFGKVILFWCHKVSKRRVVNSIESNKVNIFSQIRGIEEQGLEHYFYSFNNINFKQYLFSTLIRTLLIQLQVKIIHSFYNLSDHQAGFRQSFSSENHNLASCISTS